MKQIIQWCIELGVQYISVYAFSIDNFKRPTEEVDSLMQLALAKFEELLHVSNRITFSTTPFLERAMLAAS